MQTAKATYKREATKYKNGAKYSREKRLLLKKAALEAKELFLKAKEVYTKFPAQLHFVNFPIPDEYVVSDELTESLCREIEGRIRDGQVW
jgi:hypothetical protein